MKNMNFIVKMKKTIFGFAAVLLALVFGGCEDSAPTDYLPQTFVEGYLIVGSPIAGIMIYTTQPTSSDYSRENAAIKDAEVTVSVGNQDYKLDYKSGDNPGYAYIDENIKVDPSKKYKLRIVLKDGTLITSETTTPQTFSWTREPKPLYYYPQDTLHLYQVDSLDIAWNRFGDVAFYMLSIKCLDTLEYGKYLPAPTSEMNRRTYNIISKMEDESQYKNMTSWAFISNIETPSVWAAFKWFGKQKVSIYAPDYNMLSWFVSIGLVNSPFYDENFNSIHGGIGVFGSAAVIEKDIFLFKNQQ